MPTTAKVLFRGAATTGSTTLYTVPALTSTIVSNIVVTNTAASAGTFTLTFNGVSIATAIPINANSSQFIDLKQVVAAGQVIAGLASATSINFHISGVEIA